jgi:hypothetical protein
VFLGWQRNAAIAAFPALLCVLLVTIQAVIDGELDRPLFRCGCACVRRDGGRAGAGACAATECGVQHSTATQALSCAVPAPPRWPAVTQVPDEPYRALTPVHPARCRGDGGSGASEAPCPVAVLTTGQNRRLTEGACKPANVVYFYVVHVAPLHFFFRFFKFVFSLLCHYQYTVTR